ncbi:MAG: MBL fold metallo-hydrolase [Rhizobacter sp.]|nr:MBL fold metallo-hydrolase [Rhizobacter sp.]
MSTEKKFASQADLAEKKVTFSRLSEHAYAYTAEGDPNTGIVIGDDCVLVADTQATPAMAADVIRRIREVTDKPIKYVVLTHYHAVRVLGASAYMAEGGQQIIASQDTYDLIVERGEADKASEIGRFPRLFRNVETVPAGMTWPTITFTGKMTLWLGQLEVQLLQLGRGHTKGDTVVWLPQDRVLLSGDLVEFDATPYAGDAYFKDWPQTLANVARLQATALVPGRGPALIGEAQVAAGLKATGDFIADVRDSVAAGVAAGHDLNTVYKNTFARLKPKYGHWVIFDHCMPFDVTRCYDELTQYPDPRIWTAERDRVMWETLEG